MLIPAATPTLSRLDRSGHRDLYHEIGGRECRFADALGLVAHHQRNAAVAERCQRLQMGPPWAGGNDLEALLAQRRDRGARVCEPVNPASEDGAPGGAHHAPGADVGLLIGEHDVSYPQGTRRAHDRAEIPGIVHLLADHGEVARCLAVRALVGQAGDREPVGAPPGAGGFAQ
jgi:hypothetical protein